MTIRPARREGRGVGRRWLWQGGVGRCCSRLLAAAAVAAMVFTLRPAAMAAVKRLSGSAGQEPSGPVVPAPSGPVVPAPSGPVVPAPSTSPMAAPAPRTTAPVPSTGRVLPAAPRRPALATYTYSVRSVGPVRTDLREFAAAVRQAYADRRGWAAGGWLAFQEVPHGGDFTVWVATPDRVEAFGSVCDRRWSCRFGRNVVVNEDRWLSGSPTGLLAGDLRAYRAMVVNHETGHWLGLSHRRCPAPGAPAPLMQQQSIDLQGCRANPWPTAAELAAVVNRHPRPTR